MEAAAATEGASTNWSTAVEDLVDVGDVDGAIALLESLASKLEPSQDSSASTLLELASALTDLANLYSSKGFSLKADDALSRASLLKARSQQCLPSSPSGSEIAKSESRKNGPVHGEVLIDVKNSNSVEIAQQEPSNDSSDDDWEAIADRAPDELLAAHSLTGVSRLSLHDTEVQSSRRRGRGSSSYKKDGLYSDRVSDGPVVGSRIEVLDDKSGRSRKSGDALYGTRHVLVLADFPPTTKTIDLEKLFEKFRDRGFSIRWVNDTVALAVFRTPSIAHEAYKLVPCPFTVRILDVDDALISSIPVRDLEPSRPRPQTSARTAKRLIAHGMGLKLPTTDFGLKELKMQEEARKSRIHARHIMKNDAWGDEES